MKTGVINFRVSSPNPVSRGRIIMTKNNRANKKPVISKTSVYNTVKNTSLRNTSQTSLEDLNAPKIPN